MSSPGFRNKGWRAARVLGIAGLVAAAGFPFYYMLLLSIVPLADIQADPGTLVPSSFSLDAYATVLKPVEDGGQGFLDMLRNSALVALGAVVIALLLAIPGAYAVARLRFPGRTGVSTFFLGVYMFPVVVLAGPLYIGFAKVGLTKSLAGVMIIYVALTLPIAIHMLRNYFETIPRSIEEAAFVDGATRWTVIRRVVLPLSLPSILSTGLFVFMIAWNEFLFALLFLTADRDKWTVSLGLSQLTDGLVVSKTVLMAGSVILTVPIVVLYAVAERYLTEGLTSGAEKG